MKNYHQNEKNDAVEKLMSFRLISYSVHLGETTSYNMRAYLQITYINRQTRAG